MLITLEKPSKEMRLEADRARLYSGEWPKIQLLTIAQILNGERPKLPQYRQLALFPRVPDAGADDTLAEKLKELEVRIEGARQGRRTRERARLQQIQAEWQQIRESVQRVMEAEEQLDVADVTEERLIGRNP